MALSHFSFSFLSHFSLLSYLFSLSSGSTIVVRRVWAIVGCGSMVRVVGPTIVSFDFGLWVVVRQSWVMVRWSDGRGWWQRWSDGRRLCSDGHRSWVTNLLVKGCESNLVEAGWWIVGLGRNGS